MKRLKVNRRTDKRTDGRRTTGDKKSSLELSTQVSLNQEVQRLEDIFGLIHMFQRMSSTLFLNDLNHSQQESAAIE